MQAQDTRNSAPAESANGGGVVEAANSARVQNSRPTAAGRIRHPSTPLSVWLDALIATSEEQRASMRRQAAAAGVGR